MVTSLQLTLGNYLPFTVECPQNGRIIDILSTLTACV